MIDRIRALEAVARRLEPNAAERAGMAAPVLAYGERFLETLPERRTFVPETDGGASLYEWCVVRSLLTRWLDALRATAPDRGHLQLDDTELGRPDEDVTTVVDVHAHLDRRRRAIALHASQRSPYDDMPEDLVDAFLGQDRFVRVLPPWSGGPVEAALTVPERVAAAPPRRRLASLEQWVFRRHGAALRRRRS